MTVSFGNPFHRILLIIYDWMGSYSFEECVRDDSTVTVHCSVHEFLFLIEDVMPKFKSYLNGNWLLLKYFECGRKSACRCNG